MTSIRRLLMALILAVFITIWLAPAVAIISEAFSHDPAAAMASNHHDPLLFTALANTVVVSFTASLLACTLGATAGYALSKKRFYGRKLLFGALLASVFIPPTVMMAPMFRITASLGIYDTLAALILPASASGFAIVFMKVAIDRIPASVIDAAHIDGLGEVGTFARIVLPQVRAPLAALFIIEMISNWGALAVPLAVIDRPENYTLTLSMIAAGNSLTPEPRARMLLLTALIVLPAVALFLLKAREAISGTLSTYFKYERIDADT